MKVLSKEDKAQIALGVKVLCDRCDKLVEKKETHALTGPFLGLSRDVCWKCYWALTTTSTGPRP